MRAVIGVDAVLGASQLYIRTAGDCEFNSAFPHFAAHPCNSVGLVQGTKTPQGRKYEKNTKKLQNPPPWVGPRKYEKITEKIQKWPTQGGGFCNFFVFFSYFRPWGVFVPCTSPTELQAHPLKSHEVSNDGSLFREEHSMDQYRSRLKLSENFERRWSIQISGGICMDQSLVHTFSWGNSYGPMVLKAFLKFPTLALVHGWLLTAFCVPSDPEITEFNGIFRGGRSDQNRF